MNENRRTSERHASQPVESVTRMNKEIEVSAQGEELLLFEWYTQHSKAEHCPVFSRTSGFRGTSQTLRPKFVAQASSPTISSPNKEKSPIAKAAPSADPHTL